MATAELDPLQSIPVEVTFSPTAVGAQNTLLTIESNDPDSPDLVYLFGNGVMPPVMVMEPDTMEAASLPGHVKTETMALCNDGGSDMTFNATWSVQSATAVATYSQVELPKTPDVAGATEADDPRPGILGSGGPDAFGHTWVDSDDPSGPVFDWVDVSGVGTPIDFGGSYKDDGNSGPMPIGFSFPFYGNAFTEVRASTNGWLSFTNTGTDYSNDPLPNGGTPENLLAVFWDDMVYDESDGASAYYHYDGTRAIFQFNNIRRIGNFTPPFYSYEVILYPNGNIVYQYLTLGGTLDSHTIGIQNDDGTDGLTVVYDDGSYTHDNLAILFTSGPQWLSVSPESGVVPAGECIDLTVTMDATALEEGDYYGTVTMTSNDPAHPTEDMEVVFHVRTVDAAYTEVDPNTLNLASNGKFVTGYVELPSGYDPADVVLETVMLNDQVPALVDKSNLGDFNSNGVPDWAFKFDRSAVEGILGEGDSVTVVITGEILHTAYFWAEDMIRVINPHLDYPNGGEYLVAGSLVDVSWRNPQGWSVDHAMLAYSPDAGATWSVVADDIQETFYGWRVPTELTETARLRVYVVDNKGVMGYDSSDETFQVVQQATDVRPSLPIVHALFQNAPNPFKGSTRIAFDLPTGDRVRLTIFDVSGREVRVLEDRNYPAGSHLVSWDGRDGLGVKLASGIYFYRLEAGDFTAVKRLFLLK